MIDLLFLTFNRREFARQSWASVLRNTNWDLVSSVYWYDDGSTDGTFEMMLQMNGDCPVPVHGRLGKPLGGPVAIMNDFLKHDGAPIFCKLDSDVIVPPGWLDQAFAVMDQHPELDLLGLEPVASRTGSPQRARRNGGRIYERSRENAPGAVTGYVACDSIGGVGLMRRSAFAGRPTMRPFATYGGFTDWQLDNPIRKGWIAPALKLFLLDRLPMEPWKSLSREYIARGWQRPWTDYVSADRDALWGWWTPLGSESRSELEATGANNLQIA